MPRLDGRVVVGVAGGVRGNGTAGGNCQAGRAASGSGGNMMCCALDAFMGFLSWPSLELLYIKRHATK